MRMGCKCGFTLKEGECASPICPDCGERMNLYDDKFEFVSGPLKGTDTTVEIDNKKYLVKGSGYYIRER